MTELETRIGDLPGRLTRAYRFAPAEARLAAALYAADGQPVPVEDLERLIISDGALAEGSLALKAQVWRLRQKLSPGAIETRLGSRSGRGNPRATHYALSDEGRALIYTALKVAA